MPEEGMVDCVIHPAAGFEKRAIRNDQVCIPGAEMPAAAEPKRRW